MSFFRDLVSMVSSYIQFEDANTKESLINNDAINIDADHEISYKEAAAYNTAPTTITVAGESFKEFQYFTGVTKCQINGENLKILTLPPNATSNGYGTQSLTYYCPNLEEINIISPFMSGSDNVFVNNKSLFKVNVINDTDDILSSVLGSNNGWFSNNINGGYFYYKNNIIHNITVHSITTISSGVLRKDKSITSIDFNNKIISIGYMSFRDSILQSISNTNSVITLSSNCFRNSKIINVTFNNVTSELLGTFAQCSNLTDISLPLVTTLSLDEAVGVFDNCSNLVNCNIPLVTNIGNRSFSDCNNLIELNCSPVTIGGYAMYGCSKFEGFNSTSNIVSIGVAAFCNCKKFNQINFNNATSIARSAFFGCSSLTEIELKNNNFHTLSGGSTGSAVDGGVFQRCVNLTKIDAPNITIIQANACNGCSKLTTITWNWNNVKFIGQSAFEDVPLNMPNELYCKCIGHAAFRLRAGGTTSDYVIFRFDGSDISDINDYPSGANGQDLIRNGVVGFIKFLNYNKSPFTDSIKTIYVPDSKKQLYLDSIWGQMTLPSSSTSLIIKGYSEADFTIN